MTEKRKEKEGERERERGIEWQKKGKKKGRGEDSGEERRRKKEESVIEKKGVAEKERRKRKRETKESHKGRERKWIIFFFSIFICTLPKIERYCSCVAKIITFGTSHWGGGDFLVFGVPNSKYLVFGTLDGNAFIWMFLNSFLSYNSHAWFNMEAFVEHLEMKCTGCR